MELLEVLKSIFRSLNKDQCKSFEGLKSQLFPNYYIDSRHEFSKVEFMFIKSLKNTIDYNVTIDNESFESIYFDREIETTTIIFPLKSNKFNNNTIASVIQTLLPELFKYKSLKSNPELIIDSVSRIEEEIKISAYYIWEY